MRNFTLRSTSSKGNFELLSEDGTVLYTAGYKSWFSGEAISHFDNSTYSIRSANFWQTRFEIFRDEKNIGSISFNWKGEILIIYTNASGTEKEFLLQYKAVWKFRFLLSNQAGEEILAMAFSWSKLHYHYDVTVTDSRLEETEIKELLLICGYSANLYINTMVAIF